MFRIFQKALRVPSIAIVLASALLAPLTTGCASAKHDFPHLASPADDIGSYAHMRVASSGSGASNVN